MTFPTRGSALVLLALLVLVVPARAQTTTPIAHLIVVVGENLSFDNLFGTYEPRSSAYIRNLLSQGIVNADGTAGSNFAKGAQFQATSNNAQFFLSPSAKVPYKFLHQKYHPNHHHFY